MLSEDESQAHKNLQPCVCMHICVVHVYVDIFFNHIIYSLSKYKLHIYLPKVENEQV